MLNQNPRQAEFVLGTCPHCQKVVRIPVTAVTSQSSSQVGCPICSKSFELASVLEEMIPAVKVVDDKTPPPEIPPAVVNPSRPKRINAIDTPELFHSISKEEYEPSTEKKNGRFVVPDLLSKGIDKKKKKRKSRRRRSSNDPDVAKSLAKLKENTSSTSFVQNPDLQDPPTVEDGEKSEGRSHRGKSRSSSRKKSSSKSRSTKRTKTTHNSIFGLPSRLLRRLQNNLASDAQSGTSGNDILMLVLGALIAIPLLHLLLWWSVGLDPFGLAKPTSRALPFMVPNSLKESNDSQLNLPVEPSQSIVDDEGFFESNPSTKSPDGKLPKPNLDPSSVHIDEVN